MPSIKLQSSPTNPTSSSAARFQAPQNRYSPRQRSFQRPTPTTPRSRGPRPRPNAQRPPPHAPAAPAQTRRLPRYLDGISVRRWTKISPRRGGMCTVDHSQAHPLNVGVVAFAWVRAARGAGVGLSALDGGCGVGVWARASAGCGVGVWPRASAGCGVGVWPRASAGSALPDAVVGAGIRK